MTDWQAICRDYGPLVWRTAYRLLGSDADAADCFQETFVAALSASRQREVRNWPGFLQRIATTRALDQLRRRKTEIRRREASDVGAMPAADRDPAEMIEDAELAANLRAALAELPENHAEVFCLRHLNELSYADIALETGLTVDHVGVALHRATAKLRQLLTPQYAPHPIAGDIEKTTSKL